jgi:signal transduction histidine kinase
MEIAYPFGNELAKKERKSVSMSDSEEAAAPRGMMRILLVADDEAHAELIRRAFDATGMTWVIHCVANLRDAVDWLAANTMPFVVLADYFLPDGTGLDLAKNAMCADEVDFPLIIMAGIGSAQMAVHTLKSGAMDFLLKSPEEFRELPWRVERAFRDWKVISRRKRLEEELALYLKELGRAAQDIEDFTLLLESCADKLDDLGREYLAGVRKATEKTTALTDGLLMVTRVGCKVLELEKVDLNELMEEILTDLGALIEDRDGHVLVGPLPTIATQRVWMKELLSTLIESSLKFNLAAQSRIEIRCEEREHEYQFVVKMNNGGLNGKDLYRIFATSERFTPQDYEGTNLRLTICKKILEKFGGRSWVESNTAASTRFYFALPKK